MDNLIFKKITECRSCKAMLDNVLVGFDSMPVAGTYIDRDSDSREPVLPLTLMRCDRCGLVQLNESLDREFYKSYRFSGNVSAAYTEHLGTIADKISGIMAPGAEIVEVGSGDGTLLSLLAERGFRVFGYEPATVPAETASGRGLNIANAPLNAETAKQAGSVAPGIIIIRHVLEHIDNFDSIFEALDIISGEDTALLVEVPDMFSTIKNGIFSNIYHPHPCYFDIDTLESLLAKYGWKIGAAATVDVFGGSILAAAGRNGLPDGMGSIIFGEDVRRTSTQMLDEFVKNWTGWAGRIEKFIVKNKRSGKTIAGYGAGERTVAALGAAGIGIDEISSIYDMNKSIQGMKMPGGGIPIKSPKMIYADMPDIIVVFAISHEDEIVASHREYTEKGGRFVTLKTSPPSFI